MPTYQEELDERRKADAVTAKVTREMLCTVFVKLGYTPDPYKGDEPLGHFGPGVHVTARREDMILHAAADVYRLADRVRFSVEYPRAKTGQAYDRDWPRPEATAALTKTTDQLAAEVRRRVLPEYEKGLELARKANAETEGYHAKRNAALATILGRAPTDDERRNGVSYFIGVDLGEVHGKIQAGGEDVRLDLTSVPVELAARIVKMIRAEVSK